MNDPQPAEDPRIATIVTEIERMRVEGGDGNRLVIGAGPAWFVVTLPRGADRGRCIAAPQRLLKDRLRLSPTDTRALRQAGFARARTGQALSRSIPLATDDDRRAAAQMMLGLFGAAYRQTGRPELSLSLRLLDEPQLDNERLHVAMRRLARERSMGSRQAVYRALLKSRLLFAVGEDGDPRAVSDISGYPSFAVFTSVEEMEGWDPRGSALEILPGWALFPRLATLAPGSLMINPDGRLGGELDRNEIEALARAGAGFRGAR